MQPKSLKTIFTTMFALVIAVSSKAQSNKHISNPSLSKFVGTWIAHKGSRELTLSIKKVNSTAVNGVISEFLEGYYLYREGSKIIEDQSTKPRLYLGRNFDDEGKRYDDRVYFEFYDQIKNKGANVMIVLLKNNPNQFVFSIADGQTYKLRKDTTFSLPKRLLFERISR